VKEDMSKPALGKKVGWFPKIDELKKVVLRLDRKGA
jgi:hypothetical protein